MGGFCHGLQFGPGLYISSDHLSSWIRPGDFGELAMQTIIVIIIVVIAAAFLIRRFLKNFKQKDACSCGCSSCPADTAATCEENPDNAQ
jgi:hypothetical protein